MSKDPGASKAPGQEHGDPFSLGSYLMMLQVGSR